MACYDYSEWHKDCPNKGIAFDASGPILYCATCNICADIEAVARRILPADAVKPGKIERPAQGQLSPGVDKGGAK